MTSVRLRCGAVRCCAQPEGKRRRRGQGKEERTPPLGVHASMSEIEEIEHGTEVQNRHPMQRYEFRVCRAGPTSSLVQRLFSFSSLLPPPFPFSSLFHFPVHPANEDASVRVPNCNYRWDGARLGRLVAECIARWAWMGKTEGSSPDIADRRWWWR